MFASVSGRCLAPDIDSNLEMRGRGDHGSDFSLSLLDPLPRDR